MNTDEIKSICAFSFTCNELKKTIFGSQFTVAQCKTYRIQPNTLYSTKVKNFENEQFRSFILSFRKLVLNNELGNLNRILNILSCNGSKSDQKRIRKIKRELKSVEVSVAGIQFGIGGNLKQVKPKSAYEAFVNGVLFHNDPKRQEELKFLNEAGTYSLLAFFHYVVYVYKQSLRIQAAIKLRCIA